HLRATGFVFHPFEADAVEFFHDAVFTRELLGVDGEIANVGVDELFGLFMRAGGAIDHWPPRPGRDAALAALLGGAGEKLELLDALATLADRGTETICAGVTAAEDDHVLVLGGELVLDFVAKVHF